MRPRSLKERLAARKQGKHQTYWASLISCRLETGRTHQVRVHLMESGLSILGDPIYKTRRQPPEWLHELLQPIDHQLLHARRLELTHPASGERLVFEAAPPPDFQSIIDALRTR